ncbi:MAG: AsmA family protein [Bacteroidales bacterium]|jgi:hypothetical protein|nr:AsmA family protein [Bacteroidales bacterium]
MRILKRVGIALLIFLLVVIIAVAIATWYLFTPENLTPIVNKQAKDYLTCETIIDKVEPTFFSTYPFFGVEINNLCLRENNQSADTLVYAKKCLASLDVKTFLFDSNIVLNPFYLEDGYVNVKIDKDSKLNLDILKSSDEEEKKEDEKEGSSFGNISLSNVELRNFNASYTDESTLMSADVDDMNATLSFEFSGEEMSVESKMGLKHLLFQTADSMDLYVDARNTTLEINRADNAGDNYSADIEFSLPQLTVKMAGENMVKDMNISAELPVEFNLKNMSTLFGKSQIRFNEQELRFAGDVKISENNDIYTDITYSTNEWDIEKIIALIPKAYSAPLADIKAKGLAEISGTVKGAMTTESLPVVVTKLNYKNGAVKYTGYPAARNINTSISAKVDMNSGGTTDVTIHHAHAKVMQNTLKVKGAIADAMNIPNYNITFDGDINLADFQQFMPKDMNLILNGKVKADLQTKFSQSAIDKMEYHKIYLKGKLNTEDIAVSMDDTIKVDIPKADIAINLPTHQRVSKYSKLGNITVDAPEMNIVMSPQMKAYTEQLNLSVNINDMVKGQSVPLTSCSFNVGNLYAKADDMTVKTNATNGNFTFAQRRKGTIDLSDIKTEINSKTITLANRDTTMFDVKEFYTNTSLQYDPEEKNAIRQWHPEIEISFTEGYYNVSKEINGTIPNAWFNLTPDTMAIRKGDIILGNSDFSLTGELTNIAKFLDAKVLEDKKLTKESMLRGDFQFVSESTDVNELMDIFNGMGVEESEQTAKETETVSADDDPFMVPKGVKFRLNTNIKHAKVGKHIIDNVKGGLTVKDGILVLDQMGFTSKAANMQLTALYESPRKNHLFTNVDFHLLNINIEELIDLVPYVDTIVPMLKVFKGRGEFHMSGEAYFKSNYDLKMSTLRAAAAFEAQDLTVIDNETFNTIAKWLKFKRKTENKVDSLNVEMTVFRDEVDLYPFQIVMDKYKAVISGRHNLDNSFQYHISLTDCPLPIRLGLDVFGTIDSLDYKREPCKYKHLYRPKKRGEVDKRILRLKKMISESLKETVRPVE